ncbi:hypothetical protein LTR66_010972 [Elasticomyces elasticus]|nr:hypothetical protein LTR66_010972 [Elasticomyces elasticus]
MSICSEISSNSGSDSGYSSAIFPDGNQDIFIPAPQVLSRDDAFDWHITTRNFFAWMFNKPIVGAHLGKSLVDTLERMVLFRSDGVDNVRDFLAFAERMGYMDFVHCPDYALAMLYFAEHFQLQDLWTDAFAHCVGMNDILYSSAHFDAISKVSKALITRAYLEMDLHLGRVSRALSNFLEDDLSSAHLGLSVEARTHLDRFRSFLCSFYVAKFGYWPPPQGPSFDKALYRSMYYEFNSLYELLVDTDSTADLASQTKLPSGGICALQNVNAFDQRHRYDTLPHPLPLLPAYRSTEAKSHSQRGLRALRLSTKRCKNEKSVNRRSALFAATNTSKPEVLNCTLVQEYIRFEREHASKPDEKVSLADARKVRWILIYGVLQMLISVTRAPKEVRDTEAPSYSLCCLVAGTPPWAFATVARGSAPLAVASSLRNSMAFSSAQDDSTPTDTERPSTPMSIHPDCEVHDYFTHRPSEQRLKNSSGNPAPAHTRASSTPVSRTSSLRSLHKTMRSSLSFSSRRNSFLKAFSPLPTPNHCEIMVHGYGNGLNEAIVESPTDEARGNELNTERMPGLLDTEDYPAWPEARTPTLESFHLDTIQEPESPTSEISIPTSPVWSSADELSSSSEKDDSDTSSYRTNFRYSSSSILCDLEQLSQCSLNTGFAPSRAQNRRSSALNSKRLSVRTTGSNSQRSSLAGARYSEQPVHRRSSTTGADVPLRLSRVLTAEDRGANVQSRKQHMDELRAFDFALGPCDPPRLGQEVVA